MTAPAAGPPAARHVAAVLAEPAYRRLWLSGLCVNTVRWMELVTLGWLAFALTGSPFLVAVAAFARAAPMMVVGPFAGLVADRVSRGHLLLATQAGGLVAAVALGALLGTGAGGYRALVALEAVLGVLWALDFPARRTALYSLLGPARVAQAVSLETVSMQVAKMVGPLGAGLVLAGLGPAAAYQLMGLGWAAGLWVSLGLERAIERPPAAHTGSLLASLGEGLRVAWADRTVRAVLLITVAMNTLFFPYQPLLAVFAHDVLAGGPTVLGALVAADGLGALAGALALAAWGARLRHDRLFAAAVLVAPGLLVAFAASRSLLLCLALLAVIGVAESGFAAMQSTLVLLNAPPRARGGAMGILSACIGTQPLGTLAIGLLAAGLGTPLAFGLNALVALLVIVPLAAPLVGRGQRA